MDNPVIGPRSLFAITAVLSVIDAVGIHAVLALNQGHGHLVKARVVAGPPPSDRWYRLFKQLERDFRDSDRVSADSYDDNAANVGQQVCELLVCAAAFFAAETSDLEDQLSLLPDDPEHKTLQAQLTSIANQAGHTADALLEHAEDGAWQELLHLHDSSNVAEVVLGTAKRRAANTPTADVVSLAGSMQAQPKLRAANVAIKDSTLVGSGALPRLKDAAAIRGHIRLLGAVASLVALICFGLGGGYLSDGGGKEPSPPIADQEPLPAPTLPDHVADQEPLPAPTLPDHVANQEPLPAPTLPDHVANQLPLSGPISIRETPPSPIVVLGGLSGARDLNHYCISEGFKEAYSTGWGWRCRGKANGTSDTQPEQTVVPDSACAWAYGKGAIALLGEDAGSPLACGRAGP